MGALIKNKLQEYVKFFKNPRNWVATGSFDIYIFIVIMALLAVGLVMMFSASYVSAANDPDTNYNAFYYIKKQIGFAVAGIVIMLIVSRIKYTTFKFFAEIALAAAFALLILVLFKHKGENDGEDFRRWLEIAGIRFQPSEAAKFAIILYLAKSMEKHSKSLNRDWKVMIPYIALIGIVCVLMLLENHLSGTILILGIGMIMLYLGGGKLWMFIALGSFAVFAVIIVISKPDILKDYAEERIVAWLDKDYEPLDARYQTNQSLYAIGSGGLFGLGLGNSKQKHLYMPEPQNDFVFSIVCEELGFIGAVIIILLFAVLIFRGFIIGIGARDRFGSLLTMGIMTHVGLQMVLNIMVVTDTLPNTGIGLPFFSSGGTALIVLLTEMGLVLGVSRYAKIIKK